MPRGWGVRSVDNTLGIAPMARQGDVANMNVHDTLPAADGDRTRSALIGAATAALAGRNRDIPPDFVAAAVRACGPRGFRALPAGRTRGRRRAVVGAAPGAQTRRAKNPLRAGRGEAGRGGARNHQRRHAVPGRLDRRRDQRTWSRHPPAGPPGIHGRAQRDAGNSTPSVGRIRVMAGAKASFTSMSMTTATPRRVPTFVRTLADILAEVRVCVQDWRPMLAPPERGHRGTARRAAAAACRRDRRSDRVSAVDRRRQFHPARRARLRLHRQRARARAAVRDRSRPRCGRRKCGSCSAAISSSPPRRKSANSSTSRS